MRYNLFKVDREGEGVGRRGENSAEGPRLLTWKLRTGTASLSPLLVSIQLEVLQSPGGGQLLGGKANVFLPSF